MKKSSSNNRIFILAILAFLLGTLMILNVLLIELNSYHLYSNKNLSNYKKTSEKTQVITSKRGTIFDRNNTVIAQDRTTYNILFYLSKTRTGPNNKPAYVVDKDLTAELVSEIIGCSKEYLLKYLNMNLYQTEIGDVGRNLTLSQKNQIESLNLPGISFTKITSRYYPMGNFAPYVVGYAHNIRGTDDSYTMDGNMGIELKLNKYLKGTDGLKRFRTDANGYELPNETIEYTASKDGCDVYLTLDLYMQTCLNDALEQIMKANKTITNTWGVIMEAKTGKILASGNYPTFDQNNPKIDSWLDYTSMVSIEPGSLIKTIMYASVMDYNPSFSIDDIFYSNPLYYKYNASKDMIYRTKDKEAGSTYLQNFTGRNDWGNVTYKYGYEQSLNVGTASFLEKYIDIKTMRKYYEDFGFFKKIGIYGIDEASGVENLTNPVDAVNSTYGQASSFTVMQILQAYSAFCNKGTMVKPYVIDKIVDPYTNQIIYQGQTETAGKPISEQTASRILDLMYETYNGDANWWNKAFVITDTKVGGKTGTGEVSENGSYSGNYIHSFISILPIDDPQYICIFEYKNNDKGTMNEFPKIIKSTLQKIYNKYLVNETNIDPQIVVSSNKMVNLINHSEDYVNSKCEQLKVNQIKIGVGNTVIDQYPKSDDTIITGQNVFVLYGKEGITMPDMTGWSNNEILKYWDLIGIAITIKGNGYVYKQSIPANELIGSNSEIIVELR